MASPDQFSSNMTRIHIHGGSTFQRPASQFHLTASCAGTFVPSFRPLEEAGSIDILIAGCGTGLEFIAAAQRFPESRVLAIDLSLSSLCYAKRKTQELLKKNVEYAQADIMQLGSIGQRFDVIMSMGVLHRLRRTPLAGLREMESVPSGREGSCGLRPVAANRRGRQWLPLQDRIEAGGYAPNANDIRRFRQDLILGGMDDRCRPLAHLRICTRANATTSCFTFRNIDLPSRNSNLCSQKQVCHFLGFARSRRDSNR